MKVLHLIDLDGVLADDRGRIHHALAKEWTQYFAKIPNDQPLPEGRQLYRNLQALGVDIGYLTGRRCDTRGNTVTWLGRYGYDTTLPLIMRRWADAKRKLPEFKVAVLLDLLHEDGSYTDIVLYDDDPAVVNAINSLCQPHLTAVHCTWTVKATQMVAAGVA